MLIDSQPELYSAVEQISTQSQIAVDTEFYWMRTYYPQLCLIQIATCDKVFLIDTLAELDFSILKNIFESKQILKIMHSGSNDIPIIKQFLNSEINNIFDTQVVAGFLGYQLQLSLKNLLLEILGIELKKDLQFSDWRKRPLSNSQQQYAIEDVKYLSKLKKNLNSDIKNNNLEKIIQEEFVNITQIKFNTVDDVHTRVGNIKKFTKNIQRNIILLAQWREKTAQDKNIPIRFIFDNNLLYKLAHISPTSINQLNDYQYTKTIKPWLKKNIITALKSQQNIDNLITKTEPVDKIPLEIIEKIYNYFNSQVKHIKFDKSIIASKKDIRSLAYNLKFKNTNINSKLLNGWRYEIVGKKLEEYILNNVLK